MSSFKKIIALIIFGTGLFYFWDIAAAPVPVTINYNYPPFPAQYPSSTTLVYNGGFYNCLTKVNGAGFLNPPTVNEYPTGMIPSGLVWSNDSNDGAISFNIDSASSSAWPCIPNAASSSGQSILPQAVPESIDTSNTPATLTYGGSSFSFFFDVALPPTTATFTYQGSEYDLQNCVLGTSVIKCIFQPESSK